MRRLPCIHEAGHAVAAVVTGVPFIYVTVARSDGTVGHVNYGDLSGYPDEDLAPTFLGGLAAGGMNAESICTAKSDIDAVLRMFPDELDLHRHLTTADDLVGPEGTHRHAVETVADALAVHETLDAPQVLELLAEVDP